MQCMSDWSDFWVFISFFCLGMPLLTMFRIYASGCCSLQPYELFANWTILGLVLQWLKLSVLVICPRYRWGKVCSCWYKYEPMKHSLKSALKNANLDRWYCSTPFSNWIRSTVGPTHKTIPNCKSRIAQTRIIQPTTVQQEKAVTVCVYRQPNASGCRPWINPRGRATSLHPLKCNAETICYINSGIKWTDQVLFQSRRRTTSKLPKQSYGFQNLQVIIHEHFRKKESLLRRT